MTDGSGLTMGKTLWNVRTAADRLGISADRLYRLATAGLVPSVRLGKLVRFNPDAIEQLIASGGRGYEE